jgi:hypothetical protein
MPKMTVRQIAALAEKKKPNRKERRAANAVLSKNPALVKWAAENLKRRAG